MESTAFASLSTLLFLLHGQATHACFLKHVSIWELMLIDIICVLLSQPTGVLLLTLIFMEAGMAANLINIWSKEVLGGA